MWLSLQLLSSLKIDLKRKHCLRDITNIELKQWAAEISQHELTMVAPHKWMLRVHLVEFFLRNAACGNVKTAWLEPIDILRVWYKCSRSVVLASGAFKKQPRERWIHTSFTWWVMQIIHTPTHQHTRTRTRNLWKVTQTSQGNSPVIASVPPMIRTVGSYSNPGRTPQKSVGGKGQYFTAIKLRHRREATCGETTLYNFTFKTSSLTSAQDAVFFYLVILFPLWMCEMG